jgi:hypothetical protein
VFLPQVLTTAIYNSTKKSNFLSQYKDLHCLFPKSYVEKEHELIQYLCIKLSLFHQPNYGADNNKMIIFVEIVHNSKKMKQIIHKKS